MSIEFTFDIGKFARKLEGAAEAVSQGAVNGMDDALELWQLEATNLAPIGRYKGRRGGNLRARIEHTTPKLSGNEISGAVVANAFNRGFNYAYYLHNVAGSKGAVARESGTVLDFLAQAKDNKESKMFALIEDAIQAELSRKGLT